MIALLVTLALFVTTGDAVGRMLPAPRSGDATERIAVAYLTGLVTCGAIYFLATLAGVPFGRVLVSTVFAGAAMLSLWRRQSGNDPSIAYPRTATGLAAIPVVALLVTSAVVPLNDYDGRAFWLLKARAITAEKSVDGDFFQGRTGYDPRNRYPLLMPLDTAAIYSIAGDDDRNARWLFALTGISFLLLLRRELAARVSPSAAAWTVALLAWTPQLLLSQEGSAMSAYADVPLAAFSAAAFFALLDRNWIWFGFWLCGAILTKNEGLAIAGVLCALAVVQHGRSLFDRRILPAALAITATIGALLTWQQSIPPGDEHNLPLLLLTLPEQLGRLPLAAWSFFRYWADIGDWGFVWIAFAVASVAMLVRREREAAIAIGLCAIVSAIYVATYAVSPWRIGDLAGTSANRLLLHIVGPAAYVIAAGTQAMTRRREVPGAGQGS